ncbi:MAG: hypothetical protein KGN02_14165 [bacterium]|nr:hypothetical protein [bacterium]
MRTHIWRLRALVGLAAAVLAALAPAQAACTSPHITSTRVVGLSHDAGLSQYRLAVTVTNASKTPQPGNTLQFVDLFYAGSKIDARGIPPLRPGASYTATFTFHRSAHAGLGTTTLTFRTEMRQPVCADAPEMQLTF